MTIKQMEKVARGNVNRYNHSDMYGLECAYKKASAAKRRAWEYCLNLMTDVNGYGLKVLSYNTFMFTAAFLFTDPENGNLKMMYITPNYDVSIDF